MKKIIAASAMAMVLATGAAADLKVGLGYTIADTDAINTLFQQPVNIRVPIDFDFGLRIEPELGFGSRTTTNNGPFNVDETDTIRTIAVGGYYNLWNVEKVNFYTGGRLALTHTEEENENGTGGVDTTKRDNTSIQGLFGAEYMFTEDFSFGAQAGLEYNSGSEDGGSDNTSTGTVAHLLIHYFF